ncbi:MAG: co-chaperone GroES [Candidatus Dojkabacteria bacterium]|nr:MAG: co-chaperone GroES [Candidatus Dojkabacteria bacterium]
MAKDAKLQPLGSRVVVMPDEAEETTSGGLIIPPTAQGDKKPEVGVVVKLGTGKKDFTFSVKVGDRVFFKKYAPDEIEIDGQLYYILEEEEILAVLAK